MKIYLSRATTRAMMADYPIGDPTGGPAYGEKRDPISAAFSVYSMYSAGAAIAGEVGLTLMTGLSFVGGALSLIGNITGNKTLSQIGMVAGIAGGIGGYLQDTNFFGDTAQELMSPFGKSSVSLEEVSKTPASGLTPVVDGASTAGPGTNAYLSAEAANPPPSSLSAPSVNTATTLQTPAPVPAAPAANLAITPGSGASPIATPEVSTAGLGLKQSTDYSLMSKGPGAGLKLPNSTGLPPGVMDLVKEGKFGQAAMTAGGKAMDFASSSPYGAYVAAQAIGAGAEYLSGLSDAKLDEMKASTGYYNAKALEVQTALDREKEKRANKNMAYNNIDAGIRVNQPGLIASNMQQSTTG